MAGNTPESLKAGTGHATSHEQTAVHKNQKQTVTSEGIDPAVNAQHCDGKHMVEDTTEETTTVHSTVAFIMHITHFYGQNQHANQNSRLHIGH